MIRNRRDKELLAKQEGGISDDRFPTTSRVWSSLKNPRIVRVSRLFGGKDRHSKVSTIRGLRDRRVRLSVPTAIQLYDLQDRLGLSQPSKVVDWLLDAAQHEIDKLPPLSIPQGNYVQSPQSSIPFKVAQSQTSSRPSAFENSEYLGGNGACSLALSSKQANEETYNNAAAAAAGDHVGTLPKSTYRDFHALQRNKQKEAMTEARSAKGNTVEGDEVPNQGVGLQCFEDLDNGPLPRIDDSSLSGLLNNSMPCSPYYQWDPSNAYVSHSESHSSEAEGPNMFTSTSISSSMSLMPGSQLVYYPSGAVPAMVEKQFDHFHMTSSVSKNLSLNSLRTPQQWRPAVRFFQSNLAPKQHHSQNQSAN